MNTEFILFTAKHIRSIRGEYAVASTVRATDPKTTTYDLFLDNVSIDYKTVEYDILIKSLHQLVPSNRLIFNLHVVDGFSLNEMADILETSEYMIKSHLEKPVTISRKTLNLTLKLPKMSNLFNYELDETRIRTTLKTPECSFCENTWQAFDNLFVKEMHRQPVQESKPKVKFELNYKALTPVLFFGAIVCSSVVLFKVIRFNKNTEASVDNKTSVAKASLMPAISSAKEASSNKPDLALTTHESAATITVASTPAKAQILPAVEVSATTPVVEAAVSSATVAAKPAYKPMAKRKPATETEEVQAIQSITPAGVLTNSNEQEPELDLK